MKISELKIFIHLSQIAVFKMEAFQQDMRASYERFSTKIEEQEKKGELDGVEMMDFLFADLDAVVKKHPRYELHVEKGKVKYLVNFVKHLKVKIAALSK